MPFPANYVQGIDARRRDFEDKAWSYLAGKWRFGGWWYYYFYALAIKVPLGTWVLLVLAAGIGTLRRGYVPSWRDETVLLAPVAVILGLVSSQTGFSHHMRYVLPIFPFLFIWASKVGLAVRRNDRVVALVALTAIAWSVTSSLWVYPPR